jgi:Transposase
MGALIGEGVPACRRGPLSVRAGGQSPLRSLKCDATDLGAMAELLIRGKGHPAAPIDDAMATQAALVAHRARKVKARSALKNHVHASLDLVFPGLSGCFFDLLGTKFGRLLVAERMEPERVRRPGPSAFGRFGAHREARGGVPLDRLRIDGRVRGRTCPPTLIWS